MSRLFVEQLTVLDFSFLDAERGLVGASWIVDLELEGELDDQGMVLDFGEVKQQLKRAIESEVDHKLVVPGKASELKFAAEGADLELSFESAHGPISHKSPPQAVCILPVSQLDSQALTAAVHRAAVAAVPRNVAQVFISLREEEIGGAHYCYSHGLRKHQGLCQRIAHGHRSQIQVRIDGQRHRPIEHQLAQAWADIYLGSRADVQGQDSHCTRFRYQAQEGNFELNLPTARCDLIDTDSTVENLAQYLAQKVARDFPGQQIEVRAYEGVRKGAIGTSRR